MERYDDYIKRVGLSRYATLVKLADLQANLSANPPDMLRTRYERALAYLREREKFFAVVLDTPAAGS